MSPEIICYPGNERLGGQLGAALSCAIIDLESRHFPDGEFYFRVSGDVRGKSIVIACTLDRPNEKALGVYLLASTLRDLGASKIVLVAPYLAYMRQDRVFHSGEGVSARYFARFLSGALDALVTVDPHLHRIGALSDVYAIPTRVVHAAPAISRWIKSNVSLPFVIGPDSESAQWVSEIARDVDCPFVVLEKLRRGDRDIEVSLPAGTDVGGRQPILVDDIISTGRTMAEAAKHLLEVQSRTPICVGVHAVFAGDAHQQLLTAGASRVVTCDTIEHSTNEIDLTPWLAPAVAALL